MTESEKSKIQVRKPTGYLDVPLGTVSHGVKPTGNGGATAGSVPERTAPPPLSIRSIEDAKDPSGDLIEAVQTVFRVVTARIAHHEREAQRLREALAPFASHARQSAAPQPQSDGATVEALLRIAEVLKTEDQQ